MFLGPTGEITRTAPLNVSGIGLLCFLVVSIVPHLATRARNRYCVPCAEHSRSSTCQMFRTRPASRSGIAARVPTSRVRVACHCRSGLPPAKSARASWASLDKTAPEFRWRCELGSLVSPTSRRAEPRGHSASRGFRAWGQLSSPRPQFPRQLQLIAFAGGDHPLGTAAAAQPHGGSRLGSQRIASEHPSGQPEFTPASRTARTVLPSPSLSHRPLPGRCHVPSSRPTSVIAPAPLRCAQHVRAVHPPARLRDFSASSPTPPLPFPSHPVHLPSLSDLMQNPPRQCRSERFGRQARQQAPNPIACRASAALPIRAVATPPACSRSRPASFSDSAKAVTPRQPLTPPAILSTRNHRPQTLPLAAAHGISRPRA